jgi:hypothetical protein
VEASQKGFKLIKVNKILNKIFVPRLGDKINLEKSADFMLVVESELGIHPTQAVEKNP